MLKQIVLWLPAILIMIAIFALSSVPGQVIQSSGLGSEKIHINGHFIMFLFLCLAYYVPLKNIKIAVLLTLVYAIFDEIHQMYTPLRSASLFDIYVDSIGALLGALVLYGRDLLLRRKIGNTGVSS